MKKTLVLVGLLAVAALVLGVLLPSADLTQGPQGKQGLQGEKGLAGSRGPQGPQGLRGLKGDSGESKLGAVTGPESSNEYSCNVAYCTWWKTGRFADATTSLVSVLNPFNATATAELGWLDITGQATSSVLLDMGTSTSRFGGVASTSKSLLNQYEIATSSFATILPGMKTGTLGATSGFSNNGIGTTTEIVVGPSVYVTLFGQTPAGGDSRGILGTNNTFVGKYVIIFKRFRE